MAVNVNSFYSTLAKVLSEKTGTEIKVKEITENEYSRNNNGRIQKTCA